MGFVQYEGIVHRTRYLAAHGLQGGLAAGSARTHCHDVLLMFTDSRTLPSSVGLAVMVGR